MRRTRILFLFFLFAFGAAWRGGVPGAFAQSAGDDAEAGPRTGQEIFQAACTACHNRDGRGQEASVVGFDIPLPDFSDCNFASREPDGDWGAIVHEGGPVRGFNRMMPSFSEALSEDEIARVVAHLRTLCGDDEWPRGDLNLPRALVTEKAYPEDEAVLTTTINAEGSAGISNQLLYEKRFGVRNQFELAMPLAAYDRGPANGGWTGGPGDMAFAVKRAFYHNLDRGSIFAVTGELGLPTGDAEADRGKGTTVFEPFVTFGQILPSDWFLHLQSGVELPFDSARAGREAFWRAAVGKTLTQGGGFGRAWSPMLEVLAARELEEGAAVEWDLLPQVQVTLNKRQHIMMNVGVRLPVTEASSRDTQVMAYLLWDWFDGGFFEGW